MHALLYRATVVTILGALLVSASPAVGSSPGIEIVPSEDVLQMHTEQIDGELYFRNPHGARVRFLTDVRDREIPNSGDGRFHPIAVGAVEEALAEFPVAALEDLECSIFILPYPRSGMLSSSADGRAIYLSPGVREYSAAQIYFLVAHELGHVFQRRHLPESDRRAWSLYRQLRQIEDEAIFREDASHAYQPREVFAEDFRVLFGGPIARGDGQVENRALCSPVEVPGLRAFFDELAGMTSLVRDEARAWSLSPNPSGPQSLLTLSAETSQRLLSLVIVDATGRRVAEPRFHSNGDRSWILELGAESIARGAFFLRIRTADGQSSTLPLRRLS